MTEIEFDEIIKDLSDDDIKYLICLAEIMSETHITSSPAIEELAFSRLLEKNEKNKGYISNIDTVRETVDKFIEFKQKDGQQHDR